MQTVPTGRVMFLQNHKLTLTINFFKIQNHYILVRCYQRDLIFLHWSPLELTARTCQQVRCVSHRARDLLLSYLHTAARITAKKRRPAELQGHWRRGCWSQCRTGLHSNKETVWGGAGAGGQRVQAGTGYWGCHSRYCKVQSTHLGMFLKAHSAVIRNL